jgi:hypothetical protein
LLPSAQAQQGTNVVGGCTMRGWSWGAGDALANNAGETHTRILPANLRDMIPSLRERNFNRAMEAIRVR